MISILAFLVILSIMILVHEFGHFMQARRLRIRVESFSLGFGPKLFGFKRGFTEYKLCLFAFGGYVQMAGDSWQAVKGEPYEFLSRSPLERGKVIFAGPFLNYALAFLCFWMVNLVGYPTLTAKVGEVMAGYPAESSGLAKGDLIIFVDGHKVGDWQELREIISKKKEPNAALEVLRQGKPISLIVGLRQQVVKNILGVQEKASLIGIRPLGEVVLVKHKPPEGFILAGKQLWGLTVLTYKAIGMMLTGGMSVKDSVTGPLGMFYITSEAVKLGISALLHIMALLSASLAIFNLLPFPILDGGHILFLIVEKLRGKPLGRKAEDVINQAAIALLISLAAVISFNDFSRFGVWDRIVDLLGKWK